ncbi:ABC transporter permease [Pseudonocardia kunmingensis]|uniref:Oligopeptide transport system permease protein OppC n=1 Tax=Pseudonocardia kunmingensis TaxID=630975 RepID=A0A543CYK4_9PSEU|nr:ABC transporter permease [Pseudonocardia kunmingensis]TQM02186.1 peptide/nickel transport system permease protein [Pseudonocardia kunmingensis]
MATSSIGTGASPVGAPVTAGPGGSGNTASRRRLVARRFARNGFAVAGLATIVLLFAMAYLGPLLTPWDYDEIDYAAFLQPPSPEHWFGTTQIGNDVFAQTMRGLQKSLVIGLLVGLISTAVAAVVGAAAGYFGGWVDRSLMWVVDLLLALPAFLVIAILSPSFHGETWLVFVVLLAAFAWMITARIVRGMTLSLREREFVKAARFMGVPPWRIIFRHIVPNMSSLLIIDATITVGTAILSETGLSFFGFGVQPPDVSLGTLIAAGTDSALTYPWLFLFSAGFLVIAVLAVNLVGDGLRDALDPGSRRGRRSEPERKRKAARKAEGGA